MKEVWKPFALALLSALVAGIGAMMAFGRDAASREYVDGRVERTEQRVESYFLILDKKLDAMAVRQDSHNELHMRSGGGR